MCMLVDLRQQQERRPGNRQSISFCGGVAWNYSLSRHFKQHLCSVEQHRGSTARHEKWEHPAVSSCPLPNLCSQKVGNKLTASARTGNVRVARLGKQFGNQGHFPLKVHQKWTEGKKSEIGFLIFFFPPENAIRKFSTYVLKMRQWWTRASTWDTVGTCVLSQKNK